MNAVIYRIAIIPVLFNSSRFALPIPCRPRGAVSGSICSKLKMIGRNARNWRSIWTVASGECHLRDPRIAKIAEDAMFHFYNEHYELLAWCVMPNHVHVLVHIWQMPLWKIIQNWKIHVVIEMRRLHLLERRAPPRHEKQSSSNLPRRCSALQPFWQREYWDTFIRDEEQERKAVRYIEGNPVKAKLCRMDKKWPFSSASFGMNLTG